MFQIPDQRITIQGLYLMYERLLRFIKFKILHLNDSPHRIALGIAIGIFVAWSPTIGIQTLIALGLAFLLRANKFLAVTLVWISNPLTLIPIYYPNYLVGNTVISFFRPTHTISVQQLSANIQNFLSVSQLYSNLFSSEFWHDIAKFAMELGLELFVGGLILGAILALTAYFVTYNTVIWYRAKHPHKRFYTE